MTPSQGPQPRHVRYSVRHQARLDSETHGKIEELAHTFRRKRSAILRFVMQWGLIQTQGWTIDQSIPAAVHPVHVLLEPELLQQVQDAAAARGVTVAVWVRHAVRQVSRDDFPPSWRAGETEGRSHDSSYYGQRFMLRLDQTTATKLQHLVEQFAKPRAEIIRQLIAQASPEQFPQSWHLAVAEQRNHQGGKP